MQVYSTSILQNTQISWGVICLRNSYPIVNNLVHFVSHIVKDEFDGPLNFHTAFQLFVVSASYSSWSNCHIEFDVNIPYEVKVHRLWLPLTFCPTLFKSRSVLIKSYPCKIFFHVWEEVGWLTCPPLLSKASYLVVSIWTQNSFDCCSILQHSLAKATKLSC